MNVNISDTVYEVKKIWEMQEMYALIQQLTLCIRAGSTGGEIYGSVWGLFNKIKSENSAPYLKAKDFIDSYLDSLNRRAVPYINWDKVLE